MQHEAHEHDHGGAAVSGHDAGGVSLAAGGYQLSPIQAPAAIGEDGALRFQVLTAAGHVAGGFPESHEKALHLIVVRADGTEFGHVHPEADRDGTWSTPWRWAAAGTYRVYADFIPPEDGAEGLTLTQTVHVPGEFAPVALPVARVAEVAGFTVSASGDLVAGSPVELAIDVTKAGAPVRALEPYLGAFGHLVALREGDLAYLHVHPDGPAPLPGSVSGPTVRFVVTAPTAGRYFLYFDFQVDGEVFTAELQLDAAASERDHAAH